MTDQIQLFNNPEFGDIRTTVMGDSVLFCGKDIAEALGYASPANAIAAHCKGVTDLMTPSNGGPQLMKFITEGDVYRLVCGSRLEKAEKFERWIFDEVLPSIRKHGAYLTPEKIEEVILNPDTLIKLCNELKEERAKRAQLSARVDEMRPKELFADAVSSSHTDILVGDLAKLLRQNGVEIGQRRLFDRMRENGYLIRQAGLSWNMPTQKSMELGLFRVKETAITKPDGSTLISRTVKVTGKGQIYFVNYFMNSREAVEA